MDRVEVLAHIAAPSGFQDDRRYRAQAAAIAEFQTASKLKVYDFDEDFTEVVKGPDSLSSDAEHATFDSSSSSAWA